MTYSIGDPHNPRDDDPRYPTQEDAERAAVEQRDEWILAVWDDVTGEVLALVFDGAVYRV